MSETIQYRGKTIKIEQDTDAQSPQEWGDDGLFLVADHRDFYVTPPNSPRNFDVGDVLSQYKSTHWIFGLEAYIHSGVVLALAHCGNFPDRGWDVSQLGAVFASKKEWRLSKSARKAAQTYVETWNQYLSGDVWGYIIGEHEDSCWGFYGYDYCVAEAKQTVDCICERERKAKLATLKAYIRHAVPLEKRCFA